MAEHVVVIGAGAVGAATAIEALRRGLDVTIVEPGEPGGDQAASYGNAAWLSSHSVIPPTEPGIWLKVPGYLLDPLGPLALRPAHLPLIAPWLVRYILAGWTTERVRAIAHALRPLTENAPRLHKALAEEAGVGHLIAADSGLTHVYPDRALFASESRSWGLRREVGVDVAEIGAEDLAARQPTLDRRYRFAAVVAEGGHCRNPGAYVAALVAHAVRLGARIVRAKALDFEISGGRLAAVVTDQGRIAATKAVIAAGIRSKALAARVGNRIPLESERGYHITVRGVESGLTTPIMVHDRKIAITQLDYGLRVTGQVELAGVDAPANWHRSDILVTHLKQLFPHLASVLDSATVDRWMGHRPSTPDGKAALGRSTATPDVLLAFGHGHIGLLSSARTGRVVGDLLVGRAPEIPLAPFAPERF